MSEPDYIPQSNPTPTHHVLREMLQGKHWRIYPPMIAMLDGDKDACIIAMEVYFWTIERKCEWMYRSVEEWMKMLYISRRRCQQAIDLLKEQPWFETVVMGVPATMHYRIELGAFDRAFSERSIQFDHSDQTSLITERSNKFDHSDQTGLITVIKLNSSNTLDQRNTQNTFANAKVCDAAHRMGADAEFAATSPTTELPAQETPARRAEESRVPLLDLAAPAQSNSLYEEAEPLPLFEVEEPVSPPAAPKSKSKSKAKSKASGYVNEETGVSTRDIQQAYLDALGKHEPGALPNHGETGRSAKSLAQAGWTPKLVAACYEQMKQDAFYRDRHLSLALVAKNIGARMKLPPKGQRAAAQGAAGQPAPEAKDRFAPVDVSGAPLKSWWKPEQVLVKRRLDEKVEAFEWHSGRALGMIPEAWRFATVEDMRAEAERVEISFAEMCDRCRFLDHQVRAFENGATTTEWPTW